MEITKISALSGKINTMDIPITEEEYHEIINKPWTGKLIQHIVPHLSADHREFLMTGITPQEWDETFKDE